MTTFHELKLDAGIVAAVEKLGFEAATPIQEHTIKPLLEGRDVIAQARTGSGKTAAFGLPLLEKVKEGGKDVRGLVLAPTRELAIQVCDAIRTFATKLPVKVVAIYGGAPYPPQLKALRNGASIVVGTPGRVIDHLDRGTLTLDKVEMLVLDEADEMLRMGFLEAVERVLESIPDTRQIALFSATMPKPIQAVSKKFLRDPEIIQVESEALSVDHITQYWIRAPRRKKIDALLRVLKSDPTGSTLIFTRTRRGCAEVADGLTKRGVAADAIHGDLNQSARERVIHRLRARNLTVLVATDVAARGLDVSHLSRVINYDFPSGPEAYVHRIGRTGRAGAQGMAITFVTPHELQKLRSLKKRTRVDVEEMNIPSDAELASIQAVALWAELDQIRHGRDLSKAHAWIQEAQEETGVSIQVVAAAAIQLLSQDRGIRLRSAKPTKEYTPREPAPERTPRESAPERTPRESLGEEGTHKEQRSERRHANEISLYLTIGRKSGIRPGDIVGVLTQEAGLSPNEIGRIRLSEKNTLVGLPRDVARQLIDDYPVLTIRGVDVRLSVARDPQIESYRGKKPHRGGGKAPLRRTNKGKKRAKAKAKSRWKNKGSR